MFQPHLLQNLYFEGLFSLVIVLLSFMIYFRTQTLYSLSKHRGIKYFRQAFLFFGLTFLVKLVFPLFRLASPGRGFPEGLLLSTLMLFFETVAIFYLLYSLVWKKINLRISITPIIFSVSAILALLGPLHITKTHYIIQPIIFLFVLLISLYNYFFNKKSKKHFSIHLMYILLFLSLAIHNIAFFTLRLSIEWASFLYIISLLIFGLIFFKVWRKT